MTRLRSASPRAWALLAAAVTAAVALIVFLVVMADAAPRRTGTNSLVVPTHAEVPQGKRLCQRDEYVSAGSRTVAPWAGGPHGTRIGPVDVTVGAGGRVLATGESIPGYPTGIVPMPLDRTIERDVAGAEICFTNRDQKHLFMYGDFAPGGTSGAEAPITNQNLPTVIRLDWYAQKPESWWQLAPEIATRFPLVKAGPLGPWSMWVVLAVALLLPLLALRRVLREAPR